MIQSVANFIFTEGTWFLIIISLKIEWIKVRVKWMKFEGKMGPNNAFLLLC